MVELTNDERYLIHKLHVEKQFVMKEL